MVIEKHKYIKQSMTIQEILACIPLFAPPGHVTLNSDYMTASIVSQTYREGAAVLYTFRSF